MYRLLFGIAGTLAGFGGGFLAAWGLENAAPGFSLLYGLNLFLGGFVGGLAGGILGVCFGQQIGSNIKQTLGERAIMLIFCLTCFGVFFLLIWLLAEAI